MGVKERGRSYHNRTGAQYSIGTRAYDSVTATTNSDYFDTTMGVENDETTDTVRQKDRDRNGQCRYQRAKCRDERTERERDKNRCGMRERKCGDEAISVCSTNTMNIGG